MVLTEAEKKALLQRLKEGREKKKQERENAKKNAAKVEAPPPAPTSTPVELAKAAKDEPVSSQEAKTEPVVAAPPAEEPKQPVSKPEKANKKEKCFVASSDSDSSDSEEENKKKKKNKKKMAKKPTPYFKIKVYNENPDLVQNLVRYLQPEQQAESVEEPEPARAPERPPPSRVIAKTPKEILTKPIVRPNTMRSLAMELFG
jgi:hypothetical protein